MSESAKKANVTTNEIETTGSDVDDTSNSTDDDDSNDDDDDDDSSEDKAEAAKADAEARALQKVAEVAREKARKRSRMGRAAREARRQKIYDAEDKVQLNLQEQEQVEARIIDLENKGAFERRIDKNVRQVANETQTKALAAMLGSMYKEMRQFGTPFLVDHLEERANVLKYREPSLQAALADAKKRPGDEEKSKLPAAPSTPAPKKAKTEGSSNVPMFTEQTMPAVSPAVRCIMLLTAQFFIIATFSQIAKTMNDYARDDRFSRLTQMTTAAMQTVAYAPMLAVLFAATRVRAIQLSQGDTEKHELPQPWVQTMMYCCTFGVLGQLVMVIILPIFTGTFEVKTTPDGRIETLPENLKPLPAKILTIVRYALLAMLYGGIATVCVGLCIMEGPPATRHLPVSPAVRCTIILTVTYFLVYLCSAVTSTYLELRPSTEFILKFQRSFDPAQSCVSFAPMVAILFIGARVRALQIDPANGNPQAWAQRWFFVCTVTIILQTLLSVAMPHVDPDAHFKIDDKGFVEFTFSNKSVQSAVTALWYIALFLLYTGVGVIVASVFLIQHPQGPAKTPEVAPALHCIIELSFWYFLMQTCLFVVVTIQSFLVRKKLILDKLADIFQDGADVLNIAPMLAVLFLAARIRANQLTMAADGSIPVTAGPQAWAQSMMFLVTWAAIIQAIMTCIKTAIVGKDGDGDGKVSKPLMTGTYVLNYICLACMYGGSCTIVYAMFVMSPETLPPYAHHGLPGGVVVPKPLSPGQAISANAFF